MCVLKRRHVAITSNSAHLLTHEFVRLDGLHEGDGVGVELVGLVGLVDDGEGNPEPQPLEVTHLRTWTKNHSNTHQETQ